MKIESVNIKQSNEQALHNGIKFSEIANSPEDLLSKTQTLDTLKLELKNDPVYQIDPKLTIWFNAWEYGGTEQVWAGLADSVVTQIANRLKNSTNDDAKKQEVLFLLKLHKRKRGVDNITRRMCDRISAYSQRKTRQLTSISLIGFAASVGLSILGSIQTNNTLPANPLPSIGLAGAVISAVSIALIQTFLQRFSTPSTVKNETIDNILGEYTNVPDYNKRSIILTDVIDDLRITINLIPKRYTPITIFIDDLDRCPPNRVAEVVEAINILLGLDFLAGKLNFVIGIDPEMVAAALEEAYSNIIARLPSYSKYLGNRI